MSTAFSLEIRRNQWRTLNGNTPCQPLEFIGGSSAWQRWVFSALLETSIILPESKKVENTPSLVLEIEMLLNWLQWLGVFLGRQDEIREHLLQFPDLIDVIPRAVRATFNHVPNAQLALEVYSDPEVEDKYLVLYIQDQEYNTLLMEQIEAAEAEFLDMLANREGWIQLTVDFR